MIITAIRWCKTNMSLYRHCAYLSEARGSVWCPELFKLPNLKLINDDCLSGLRADSFPDFSVLVLSERQSFHAMRGKLKIHFSTKTFVEGSVGESY